MSGTQQNSFDESQLEIIAEAGCNHEGDIEKALMMVRVAKRCGATTIKFQSFRTGNLVNPGKILDFCRKSELNEDHHNAIIEECDDAEIKPLFSAFDTDSLKMLNLLGVTRVKIPSGQIHNAELLKCVANYGLEPLVSTGMCSMRDVFKAVDRLTATGVIHPCNITLFQCTTSYPAPHDSANLLVIPEYKSIFRTRIGFSDHTPGWAASVGAVALGARVIEKHFILDDSETPDSPVSLSPDEFKYMVGQLHDVFRARGASVKRLNKCERPWLARRDYGGKNEV
jgi:sialic acid synthase SpsE